MLWLKTIHLISLVAWFAGIFYLPRLFVYHAMTDDAAGDVRFCVMERKLYLGIMMPAMLATLVSGFWLISYHSAYYFVALWFHLKMLAVALLVGYQFYCGHLIKQFRRAKNRYSHVFYRWFNEIPTLILIAIMIFVTVRPFGKI